MADVTKGTNFYIVPKVDRQSMTAAEAKIQGLVAKAAAAVEQGNEKVLANLNAKVAKATGQKNPEVKVKVSYETNSATGSIKEVRTLAASALDPMLADYKKMVQIQGQSAIKVKQELAIQRDKHNLLKQQALTLKKQSAAYKRNAQAQKLVVAETKRLEGVLKKVSTLASLKGQLRAESQKLSMMSQYNIGLNKQGELVTKINQEWVDQKNLVQGLGQQVSTAGAAAQGFGAKISAAGQAMQNAFGWIAAVVAGLTAVAGAVSTITGRVKDIQAIKLTFEGLGQSIGAQNAILSSARNIALSYGVSLRKVEGAFRRLGPAILESGGTLKDTEGAIKSIAARTTMLGLNTEQAGRYIEAFAQVMGKGKLQSEELNQQFSELDGGLRGQLKNWLAANKGITDFEGAMKRGEITSGVFLEAFEAINEEIRSKFLRSIGDTQQAIEKMGSEGGMTLNQLNAKLQTLTSIGLESIGKALAPIGKELMKVYAAFIQVFTKIAAEMPGIQKLFQGLGHVIGVILKVSLNTVILLFGVLVKVIDMAIQFAVKLYEQLKKIPGLDWLFGSLEEGGRIMNRFFDKGVDSFSKLSDETIGAKSDLEKYNDEMARLEEMYHANEITMEEYHRKKAKLQAEETKRLQAQRKKELEVEQGKLDEMLEKRKAHIERQEQLMEREIAKIEEKRDQEIAAIDETIKDIERKKEASKDYYDSAIEGVKRAAEAEKRANEDAVAALRQRKTEVQRYYSEQLAIVKANYAQQKSAMEDRHSAEMRMIDEKIARLRQSQSAEMQGLQSGPYQRRLEMAKERDLRRQIAKESDSMRKLELRAELERSQNRRKAARLEKLHQQQMAAAQAEKARKEKEQAEEKKRLDEEAKAREKELQEAQKKTMQQIANALTDLAGQKKQMSRDEKDAVEKLKNKRDAADNAFKKQLDEQKAKREKADKAADDAIKRRMKLLDKEKKKIEDIEFAIKDNADAEVAFGKAVDAVTNGALDRQLKKVRAIKAAMAQGGGNSSGSADGSSTPDPRASGGPVLGGTTYQVNELGKEGFLSNSGKLSEISAPSFGHWKAPSSGSVIPAHIWKSIKANQQTGITMPKTFNPGNATARAISTINNTGGNSQYNNSITIQSSNPVQDANRMMVEMTRLKRRRLG